MHILEYCRRTEKCIRGALRKFYIVYSIDQILYTLHKTLQKESINGATKVWVPFPACILPSHETLGRFIQRLSLFLEHYALSYQEHYALSYQWAFHPLPEEVFITFHPRKTLQCIICYCRLPSTPREKFPFPLVSHTAFCILDF